MSEFSGQEPAETPLRGIRLFVAVPLPDYVKSALAELKEERWKGFHWVDTERFHLTLRFIGEVPGQFQTKIEEALNPISVSPFFLQVEGMGRFPEKGTPSAVWVGVGSGHPHLFALKKRIEDTLFQIGLEPEKRIYQPHLTIARVNHAAEETVRQFLKEHTAFGTPPFRVERFILYSSAVREGRRVHMEERVWELGARRK